MKLSTLAARNLTRHPRRTLLAIGALALGIAAVLVLRGTIGGIQRVNISMFVDGALGAIQVHRTGYTEAAEMAPLSLDFEDTPALRQRILDVPGVRALAPRIYFGAALAPTNDEEATWFFVTAVEPGLEAEVAPRRASWASKWLDGAQPQLLLDGQFAAALGVQVPSSPLTEEQPALLAADRDEAFNGEVVEVVGTIGNGLPTDARQGLATLSLAQRLLRSPGRVAEYAIALHQLDQLPQVQAALSRALGPSFEVHAWWERIPALRDIEKAQDFFGAMMGGIVLAVVLLGVGNLQLMAVMDRTREVGTLLAVGMRRRRVVTLFVLEGLMLGLAGSLVGVLVGEGLLGLMALHPLMAAAPGSSTPQAIAPHLSAGWLWGTALAGVLGATLSSAWAARRLARMSAAEALREP